MNIGIEVSGVEKTIANLSKLQALIQWNTKQGLANACDKLRDGAIANLSPLKWSPSTTDASIRDVNSWDRVDSGVNSIILRSNSQHSEAVEFGTFQSPKLASDGRFHSDELTTTGGPFAVGANQGGAVIFATAIKPQAPKSYLRGAMSNPTTINEMISEVGKVLKTTIASVRG